MHGRQRDPHITPAVRGPRQARQPPKTPGDPEAGRVGTRRVS